VAKPSAKKSVFMKASELIDLHGDEGLQSAMLLRSVVDKITADKELIYKSVYGEKFPPRKVEVEVKPLTMDIVDELIKTPSTVNERDIRAMRISDLKAGVEYIPLPFRFAMVYLVDENDNVVSIYRLNGQHFLVMCKMYPEVMELESDLYIELEIFRAHSQSEVIAIWCQYDKASSVRNQVEVFKAMISLQPKCSNLTTKALRNIASVLGAEAWPPGVYSSATPEQRRVMLSYDTDFNEFVSDLIKSRGQRYVATGAVLNRYFMKFIRDIYLKDKAAATTFLEAFRLTGDESIPAASMLRDLVCNSRVSGESNSTMGRVKVEGVAVYTTQEMECWCRKAWNHWRSSSTNVTLGRIKYRSHQRVVSGSHVVIRIPVLPLIL